MLSLKNYSDTNRLNQTNQNLVEFELRVVKDFEFQIKVWTYFRGQTKEIYPSCFRNNAL